MKTLLDQYTTESTSDLTNPTSHGKQFHNLLLPEPTNSSFCNQKQVPSTRLSYQKSTVTPISNPWSQKDKKSSEPISFTPPRNSNKQALQHLKSKKN